MLNYEPEGSQREAAQKYKETFLQAQPEKEATSEEEAAQPEKDVVETEQEESEELVDDSTEEEETDDEEEEEETLVLKYNGEPLTVTKEKAIELAQKGYDYSQKMSEMSDKVKVEAKKLADDKTVELDKNRTDLIEATELMNQLFDKPLATKEQLDALLDDGDVEQFTRLKNQEDERKELLRQVREQRDKAQKDAQTQYQQSLEQKKQEQIAVLLEKAPEFKEQENQDRLEKFLKGYGYKEEEVASFVYNANNILLAEDARKYRELMKSGVKPKAKVNAPKVTKKAGQKVSKPTKSQAAISKLNDRLKQSGNPRDAAALYKAKYLNK